MVATKCISQLNQQSAQSASLTSLDKALNVYIQVCSIMASKFI